MVSLIVMETTTRNYINHIYNQHTVMFVKLNTKIVMIGVWTTVKKPIYLDSSYVAIVIFKIGGYFTKCFASIFAAFPPITAE